MMKHRMLRRTEVGSAECEDRGFEAQPMPGRKGRCRIPSVQPPASARQAVEGITQVRNSAVDLKWCRSRRLRGNIKRNQEKSRQPEIQSAH